AAGTHSCRTEFSSVQSDRRPARWRSSRRRGLPSLHCRSPCRQPAREAVIDRAAPAPCRAPRTRRIGSSPIRIACQDAREVFLRPAHVACGALVGNLRQQVLEPGLKTLERACGVFRLRFLKLSALRGPRAAIARESNGTTTGGGKAYGNRLAR